ncbi:unnamed protein product [Thelazia callipaeda]|uniref:ACT domain-containing protein n=1 Tax=Thelazia callipaeda TaxID=103827 RepID=A0A0N5D2L9_THECL|nr:unnamed protein product [Thelazia callipaeda]
MNSDILMYKKCSYAICYPSQTLRLLAENVFIKGVNVRYITEVDERFGVYVRLYAMVECFGHVIKAEELIEQIREQVLPFDRTFGEHPINNTKNDMELARFLKRMLITLYRRCHRVCGEDVPNIGVIVVREKLIYCGTIGNFVFILLHQSDNPSQMETNPRTHTLLTNFNLLVSRSDLRFFLFTLESIRSLVKAIPSISLFLKSAEELAWTLHSWQIKVYSENPCNLFEAGFILVDNLQKLVAENATYIEQDVVDRLFRSIQGIANDELLLCIKKVKRILGAVKYETDLVIYMHETGCKYRRMQKIAMSEAGIVENLHSIRIEMEEVISSGHKINLEIIGIEMTMLGRQEFTRASSLRVVMLADTSSDGFQFYLCHQPKRKVESSCDKVIESLLF